MIMAIPIVLLADAPSACVSPAGLAGGASIVRPVGTIAPPPFEWLGPTESLETGAIKQVEAEQGEAQQRSERAPEQCKGGPITIV